MPQSITLNATLDENRRLIVEIPEDLAADIAEVVVQSPKSATSDDTPLTREIIRARLKAAGLLSEAKYAPDDAKELSPQEAEKLGLLFSGERLSSDLIDEDRGEY